MKIFSGFLMLFGLTIILFPEFLAYLIGGFFFAVGLHLLIGLHMWKKKFKSKKKEKSNVYNQDGEKEVFNFFGYKIYKKK